MSFTEEEIAYIRSQRLARIATVDGQGQPDVTPVGFDFDGTCFYIGGLVQEKTRKYKNVLAGRDQVALVIDDLASTEPWAPRFVRVYGTADVVTRGHAGGAGSDKWLRITPRVSWSWNLAGEGFSRDGNQFGPRRTVHQAS